MTTNDHLQAGLVGVRGAEMCIILPPSSQAHSSFSISYVHSTMHVRRPFDYVYKNTQAMSLKLN